MKPWPERLNEEARLLNPAFCCCVLTSSIVGYGSINPMGMSFPLSFMILPIVLHRSTREKLPPNVRSSLAGWIHENEVAKMHFHERVESLVPFARESLLFGVAHGWVSVKQNGCFSSTLADNDINSFLRKMHGEVHDCILRARFVGKWFASAGSVQTVMALWGIRP